MPYIKQDARQRIEQSGAPENAGELNYVITWLLLRVSGEALTSAIRLAVYNFLATRRRAAEGRENNYQDFNDVLGALDGASREMWRRRHETPQASRLIELQSFADEFYATVVAPYEDIKIQENGDVT